MLSTLHITVHILSFRRNAYRLDKIGVSPNPILRFSGAGKCGVTHYFFQVGRSLGNAGLVKAAEESDAISAPPCTIRRP